MDLTEDWLLQNFPNVTEVRKLGGGGQKLVYSAEHPDDGNVVIKLICPVQDAEDVAREILAVQRVGSPRVPVIQEHGRVATPFGDCYWIREQRINGSTLREAISKSPLPIFQVLNLGRNTLEALGCAEAANIVHRDVKPENLIVDGSGKFWLLDFGIARHLNLDSRTATVLPFGKMTLGYAPPEQCRNQKKDIDGRADMFALGVTLFEALTGENPFRAGAIDPMEILRRVESVPLPRISVRELKNPNSFSDFIAAMTT